jgi:transcriptional regulator with XRE-family HTH domain
VADKPAVSFAALLRQLRVDAGLTQEELAAAAQLSLEGIGLCHSHVGDQNESTSELRQALSIYQRIGSPKVLQIHQILADQAKRGA